MKKTFGTMVAVAVVAALIGIFITAKCVTAGENNKSGRFIAYVDGTVYDTKTNRMWAAKDNGGVINWENAKAYCDNYRGGGYTDWRLPTYGELGTLYDSAVTGNSGYKLTHYIELTRCCPWASETRGSDAAYFHFNSGEWLWSHQYGGINSRALPVRSGNWIVWFIDHYL